jgi:hypothetical protein
LRAVISAKSTFFAFVTVALVLLSAPRAAEAQVHWDASLQAGGSGRIFSNGGLPGSIGPVVGVEGDVALIPLLRLGIYGDYEYADTTEPKFSSVVSFGGRLKLMLPGNRNNVHWWLFTGIGAVVWEAPAYTTPDPTSSTGFTTATATNGYFAEIPLGIGMGWRVRRPWEVVAELQGRFGFDMNGNYFGQDPSYTDADGTSPGPCRPTATAGGAPCIATGTDVFAVMLTVGIGLDQ